MTCPNPEKWEVLSMDLLDEQEARTLRQHADGCEACDRGGDEQDDDEDGAAFTLSFHGAPAWEAGEGCVSK